MEYKGGLKGFPKDVVEKMLEHQVVQGNKKDVNEKEIILIALRHNNNNRAKTAKHLNIKERTLYRKIKKYKLDRNKVYPDGE